MASSQEVSAALTAAAAARADARPGAILVVIHNFRARGNDELSLDKGDRIELIERDDEFNDGWFLGRHLSTNLTGLFPEVYTTPAPKPAFASPNINANSPRRTSGSVLQSGSARDESTFQQRPASASASNHNRIGSASSLYAKNAATAARSSLPATNDPKSTSMAATTQSPVMHETLTVIDEHMNDLNPQHTTRNQTRRDTMGSMYSSHPNARMSYVPGHETEDEEGNLHTESEVSRWTPDQVAEYLEDHGVERTHCKVFKEQEITGEVLLAMDQNSLFLKEFDLGPIGRRLRTWQKIQALQDEIRRASIRRPPAMPTTTGAAELDATESSHARNVSSASAAVAPLRNSGGAQTFASSPTMSRSNSGTAIGLATPLSSSTTGFTSPLTDTNYRPSAQGVRTMQHWRRSNVDSATSLDNSVPTHRKQTSVDRQSPASRFSHHSHSASNTAPSNLRDGVFALPAQSTPGDLDKGYFSSNEVESRTRRSNVLQKRQNSASMASGHSRNGSFAMYGRKSSAASTESLSAPIASPLVSPLQTQDRFFKAGALRTTSMPTYGNKVMSSLNATGAPVVTKLSYNSPSAEAANSPIPASSESPSAANTPQSSSMHLPFFSKTSKIPGMRTISDAVTRSEKTSVSTPTTLKEGEVSSPTKDGWSTPSTDTGARSFDMKSTGPRTSSGSANGMLPQPAPRKPRTKTKKVTSAYTRGLEKKTPAEQMEGCDYSGWMKKKSGSLMSAWRPRLFVLRGRRLSYYYSEDDTEEKGLIDISFHNVMHAMDEKLVNMHAAVTGAGNHKAGDASSTPVGDAAKADASDDRLFIFKLTPPRPGGSGVNFTRPTIHYFAVNSRQEGRMWMAALLKAVIEKDHDASVTTTYQGETISLAKAQAQQQRPPAFMKDGDAENADDMLLHSGVTPMSEQGLGIGVAEPSETSSIGPVLGSLNL